MSNHKVVNIDPKELKNIEETWHKFAVLGKYTALSISALLIVLALAFIKF